ncbi:MAG TPA: hypothetical protein VEW48_26685 [Thermoanaerobaculia bacterium]|nr:hypothetical protein [Thermoanaerobaculia bacterium]
MRLPVLCLGLILPGCATMRGDLRHAGGDLAGAAVHEVPPHTPGQWAYLGGLAAASGALESRKEDLRRQVLQSGLARNSGWTDVGDTLGRSRTTEIAAATFYAGGLLADLPRTRETGLLLGESLLAAQTTTGLLKFVFSEERPQQGGTLRYFHAGGTSASVHVTNAMVLARVLDHQLSGAVEGRTARALIRIGLYSIPAVTGWQRLRSDQHYLWNVVLGGGASLYMTNAVLRRHDRSADHAEGRLPAFELAVVPARGRGGALLLVWRR